VKKSPESVAEAHGTAGAFRLKSGGDCWFGFWVEGVTILDREGLEARSCVCYRVVKDHLDNYLEVQQN
jgi:hypothetical protein